MKKPGIKLIKQIELATKWRPLVPVEYQDNVCPIPSKEILDAYKVTQASNKNKKRNRKGEIIGTLSREDKMSVAELKNELKKLKLPRTGVKEILLQRLKNALARNSEKLIEENEETNK